MRAFGRRAFRRPLTDDEVAGYLGAVGVRRRGQRLLRRRRSGAARAAAGSRASSTASRSARRSPGETGLYRLDDYEIGDPAVVLPAGARRPSDALLDMAAAGALSTRRRPPRRRDRAARRPARRRARQAVPRVLAGLPPAAAGRRHGRRRCAPRPTRWSTRVVFERRGDYFDLFTLDRDVRQRHAGHALRPAARRASATRRLGALRRQPAAGHPVARRGAGGGRQVRRHQPHAARRVRAQPPAVPDHPAAAAERRRRPAAAARPPAAARSTATPRTAAAAAPAATARPIRSASAWRTTIAPAPYRTADKDAPECTISGDGEVGSAVRHVQRPGRAGGPADRPAATWRAAWSRSSTAWRSAAARPRPTCPTLVELTDGFKQGGRAFDELLVDVVADPAFIHRQLEP